MLPAPLVERVAGGSARGVLLFSSAANLEERHEFERTGCDIRCGAIGSERCGFVAQDGRHLSAPDRLVGAFAPAIGGIRGGWQASGLFVGSEWRQFGDQPDPVSRTQHLSDAGEFPIDLFRTRHRRLDEAIANRGLFPRHFRQGHPGGRASVVPGERDRVVERLDDHKVFGIGLFGNLPGDEIDVRQAMGPATNRFQPTSAIAARINPRRAKGLRVQTGITRSEQNAIRASSGR